ncbi:hypothetical protein ALP60_101851 [Pseudomonas savastanoi]|uniref:Uncharacterized protein n=1 Tax=Pseudomonas savastanoi TaxID=29438 RepID=A0A3M5GCN1_PSESS|nr:hypothetical protein ALP60_101851 [Pseudomonas savastanoi]
MLGSLYVTGTRQAENQDPHPKVLRHMLIHHWRLHACCFDACWSLRLALHC